MEFEAMNTDVRLNNVIAAFEEGRTAFVSFSTPEPSIAIAVSGAPYDGVLFELEHNPYDIKSLRDAMQYMLDRKSIREADTIAPVVTPLVRIPSNGREMNQWMAKQVLDAGAFGVIWPHIETVEQARNAVSACRYPRGAVRGGDGGRGERGDGPKHAVRYWGLTQQEYYARADVWPINPKGEILVGIMCETVEAIKNLPDILSQVPGIGMVLVGEGDLSQDLGYPRQTGNPEVVAAVAKIRAICAEHNVVCAHPNVNEKNVKEAIDQGYRCLLPSVVYSFASLNIGRDYLSSKKS